MVLRLSAPGAGHQWCAGEKRAGTDTMQALIVGHDITGMSA
jgi:hypothetical protein